MRVTLYEDALDYRWFRNAYYSVFLGVDGIWRYFEEKASGDFVEVIDQETMWEAWKNEDSEVTLELL